MERIKATSVIKDAKPLDESNLYSGQAMCSTAVTALNIALSGKIDGGLGSGALTIAGPSRHFKSLMGLILAGAYLQKHKDAVMLFYDSEFGTPEKYFDACGIDRNRVMHIPVKNIEELKFYIVKQMEGFQRGDHVFTFLDSIGNIASKKEVDDALNDKSVADMTRAKAIKSLYRMITPYLTINDVPFVAIAHTYEEMGLFPKQIVSGGKGIMYGSNAIWMMGRRQEKEGTDIAGYTFTINIEKSRFVREKSKVPITVTYEGGLSKYSGLIDIAKEGGYVLSPKQGWYVGCDATEYKTLGKDDKDQSYVHQKNYRLKETNCSEFWDPIFKTDFAEYVEKRYALGNIQLMVDEMPEDDDGDLEFVVESND